MYGPAKSGKTRLTLTAPNPFIISTDEGLSSLKGKDVKFLPANNIDEFEKVLAYFTANLITKFQTLVIDDFTEVAEQKLLAERPHHKDGRQAYYAMQDYIVAFLHHIRRYPIPVVLIAKQDRIKDEMTGGLIYSAMIAGQKLNSMFPYMLGEVYHMESWTDPKDGKVYETLRTKKNSQYDAGSRSGKLDEIEFAHLGNIFQKVKS